MKSDVRLEHEVAHGKRILEKGEEIWNWSSPAGRIRWARRVRMFDELLDAGNSLVLEVGCGTGLFTKEIAKTGNRITAIDISAELLEQAKRRVTEDNVEFAVQNAYQTSFGDGVFDFVVGSSVLHHLDARPALAEFFRILKPGGRLLFTEPNMMNPQIAIQKNVPFIKRMLGDSPDETAFFRWRLKKMLTATGFKNAKVTPFDFLHPAIPGWAVRFVAPPLLALERVPLLKEISGSLVVEAER